MAEVAAVEDGGCTEEDAVEADQMLLDVEVAVATVDARRVDAPEILETVEGGRSVEVIEAVALSRLVEADRMSFDTEVADVTVEARNMEVLEGLEATP